MDPDTDVCRTEQPQISYSVDFTAEQSSAMGSPNLLDREGTYFTYFTLLLLTSTSTSTKRPNSYSTTLSIYALCMLDLLDACFFNQQSIFLINLAFQY